MATLVNSHVLRQVGLLCEALVAIGFRTDERTFSSVHAQVIEEVVPLAEVHATL